MRIAVPLFVLLIALAAACTDARSPADAPPPSTSSAAASPASPDPTCKTGGPERRMFVRLYGRQARHDYSLRGPLEDIRRACPEIVAEEQRHNRNIAIGRACDLAPLEPTNQWWLEVTGETVTRPLVSGAADRLVSSCPPPAYELTGTVLYGPYVDEAACLADDEMAMFKNEAPKMEEQLAYAEKRLASAEERLAKECPAAGEKLCDRLEVNVRAFTKQRDAAKRGVRSAFRAVCAIR